MKTANRMEKEIERAIKETLVIENPQSIHAAVNKILLIISSKTKKEII